MNAEMRAPGWQIRCLKCGFAERWGKYGIRRWAAGREFTIGRCSKCNRIRIHAIEKIPTVKQAKAGRV